MRIFLFLAAILGLQPALAATLTPSSGDWTFVRRVSASAHTWNPANDQLQGTAVYGTYNASETSNNTFSVDFESAVSGWNQLLLMTGDRSHWMILDKGAYSPVSNSIQSLPILASDVSSSSYSVTFYNRGANAEDPWLSTRDHNYAGITVTTDNETHSMLYGEASYVGWNFWRDNHQGANVFIRNTNVDVVPIPGAFWLFGSAIVGLGTFRRRKDS